MRLPGVVYNNKDDAVNMVAYEGGHIPHVFISKDAGAALAAASDKHAFVGSEMGISDSVGGNMPSDFSSRGVTSTFGIKPEITAPGGQIYSATDPSISGCSLPGMGRHLHGNSPCCRRYGNRNSVC